MTGLPGLEEMRSLNKPGLSLITLVFTDATDVYFARQLVMERLIEAAPHAGGRGAGARAGVHRPR
jgi:cobalt-zinc-cadmium resistance protein CzcA